MSAGGFCVQGYGNLPKDLRQARTWAKKADTLLARVVRPHKMDKPLKDNPGAHTDKYQMFLDSLQDRGIPAIAEVSAEHYAKDWNQVLDRLSKLDTSNIVALCPFNEPWEEYDHEQCVKDLRSIDYKGLIFGSNSMVQTNVVPGDLADIHVYCGEDNPKIGEFSNLTYDMKTWTADHDHVKPQTLPIIATEIGHKYPAEQRRLSEQNIIDHLLSVGCQAITMFVYATAPEHWLASWKHVDLGNQYQFSGDPERLPTLQWLAHRMAGIPYWRNAPGVKAERVDGDRWKVVPPTILESVA